MRKQRLVDVLNGLRAEELGAVIQYMGHHYEAEGLESPEIIELFKDTAIVEMKHAESLGERIVYLGGEPTKKAAAVKKGGGLKKMVQDDLDTEIGAIALYREGIAQAAAAGDTTTRLLLERILADEEEHADTWQTVLSRKGK